MILFLGFILVIIALFSFYFIQAKKLNKIIKEGVYISQEYIDGILSEDIYINDDERYEYIMDSFNNKLLEIRGESVISKALILANEIPLSKRKHIQKQRLIDITQAISYNIFLENFINGRNIDYIFSEINSITSRDLVEFEMEEYSHQINEIYNLIKDYKKDTHSLSEVDKDTINNIYNEKRRLLTIY